MENQRNIYDYNSYLAGMNCKPNFNISMHCTQVKNLEIEVSDLKESESGPYRIITIGTVDHYMTEKQAEKLFETMEPKLYEETFKEIEDKYLSEKVRADRLEEELEQLKEKTYIKGECC